MRNFHILKISGTTTEHYIDVLQNSEEQVRQVTFMARQVNFDVYLAKGR